MKKRILAAVMTLGALAAAAAPAVATLAPAAAGSPAAMHFEGQSGPDMHFE